MKLHDVNAADTPITNLAQTFSNIRHSYPYKEHYDLKRYGRPAGFTNSLEEKYTFFWPRFTHELVEGEVICINAEPFPKRQEGLHRVYIARSGDNYIARLLPEETVARVLREAKPTVVPTANAKPPPPAPPEVQEYIHPSMNEDTSDLFGVWQEH